MLAIYPYNKIYRSTLSIYTVECQRRIHHCHHHHHHHHLFRSRYKYIRSSAVAVIADRTAYGERYSCRPLAGTTVVSIGVYLFTVSNWSLLLMHVRLSAVWGVLWLNDTSYSKCLTWWIGSTVLGTRCYNFPVPPHTDLSATIHSVTDRWTDDSMMPITGFTISTIS